MEKYNLQKITNLQFEDLTPYNNLDDVDKDSFYCTTIEWAIERKNVKNIALTGVYGSGKSSVIRKFVNSHTSKYKILDISLANFDNLKMNNSQNLKEASTQLQSDSTDKTKEITSTSTLQELIERSIVQQMFYKEKSQSLNLSRFKRIIYENPVRIFLKAFFLAFWITSSLLFLIPSLYHKVIFFFIDKVDINQNIIFLLGAIFFTGFIVILFNLIKKLQNIKLNKFGFGGAQVEISESKDISILNKHLDEILYFFEVLDYNLVIIEDLDRFNNTEIFVKLRELNMLINNYNPIRRKRKVVFIYAIKDELFKNKDRSKFFDFIIPIIPIVNSSNSGDHMITKYVKLIHADDQMKELILDISLFIDDMRLIKNIFNEYKIYQIKLETKDKLIDAKKSNQISPSIRQYKGINTKSEYAKLFAMIVYKNLLPDDFSNLNYNTGILYEIFSTKKDNLIATISQSHRKKLDELTKEIDDINKESLSNINELRKLYLYQIFQNTQQPIQSIFVDNQLYDFNTITNDNVIFLKILDSTQIQTQNRSTLNINHSSLENIYGKYENRSRIILAKQVKKQEILYSQMTELKNSIATIQKYSLSYLLQNYENEFVITDMNNKNLPFLTYLIYNGYIDESYYDFTSFFYEGSLTKDEREYLKDIKVGMAPDYNHKIINIKNFIERLNFSNYEKPSVLNYQILDYLLLDNNIENKNAFFKLLNDSTFDFIDSYFTRNAYLGEQSPTLELEHRFIKELCQRWNGLWEHIKYTSSIDQDYYMALVLCHANIEDIKKFNMVSDILEKENFLAILNNKRVETRDSVTKMKQVIESLDLKFKTLKVDNLYEIEKLFKFIYKNDYYEISIEMIDNIIKYFDSKNYPKLKSSHYTTLKISSCHEVLKYIQLHLETYLNNVFLVLETNTEENLDTINELLKSDISLDTKKNIIKKQNIRFDLLSQIEPELWSTLLEESKIAPIWDNISLYIKENGYVIDTVMSIFLNNDSNISKLSECKIDEGITIENINYFDIEKSLIKATLLNEERYISLICSTFVSDITLEDIAYRSFHVIDCLIKSNLISLSLHNFLFLKENFKSLHIALIILNFDLFLAEYKNYPLDLSDFELLLKNNNITIANLLSVIQIIDFNKISSDNYNLVELIINFLNKEEKIKLSDVQILTLMRFSNSLEQKLQFLSKYLPMSPNVIEEILNTLRGDYVYITKLVKSNSPKFPNDSLHQNFMAKLYDNSYIESWRTEKGKICIVRKSH